VKVKINVIKFNAVCKLIYLYFLPGNEYKLNFVASHSCTFIFIVHQITAQSISQGRKATTFTQPLRCTVKIHS